MRTEDGPHLEGLVCAFHHRTSTICCISPNTRHAHQKGFLAKAREILSRGKAKEDRSDGRRRAAERNEVPNGIMLSYDVWRTVEEATPG